MTLYNRAIVASPGLVTDLYQLTMAQGYWEHGLAERNAVFQLFFRRPPFGGRFLLVCGIQAVIDFLQHWRFSEEDLKYLGSLAASDGRSLFCAEFLNYLRQLSFRGKIWGVPEGTPLFPNEPILRVEAPLAIAQLLETPLLNLVGFASLVATKAVRVCRAAAPNPVIEFGLRRSQGFEAGLIASRAAYIGGCLGTSNVLAGSVFKIPVRGTQAHSWVLSFDDEAAAFAAYAKTYPTNCILVVDTFNTMAGVKNAIAVAQELKAKGHRLLAIRLDSGDLAKLSRLAREMLNEAGLQDVIILASGDLDEYQLTRLKLQGACVDAWGVGTRLATAFDEPALTVVYKLTAIQNERGEWEDKMKISSEKAKRTIPGILRIRRFYSQDKAVCDLLYDERDDERDVAPAVLNRPAITKTRDLLVELISETGIAADVPDLQTTRQYAQAELLSMPEDILSLRQPAPFKVLLSKGIRRRQRRLQSSREWQP
ncbi:MAG: nicotinate phosphoribosyltransferase [Thermogutta sp.]